MAALFSISERVAEIGEARISYLEAGKGPALVLLHGIGSGAASWRAQLQALSQSHRVIAWNAPGYGQSTPLKQETPVTQDYALALNAFLDALDIAECDLAGHSLGALMAARFARAFPRRARSLTLAGCAIGHARMETGERQRLLESRIGDVVEMGPRGMAEKRGPRLVTANAPEAVRRAVIDTMASVDPSGYAQAARMLSTGDMLADIGALPSALRVQFIYGAEDVITPPEVNLRAAAMRPSAPVHVVEGAGHALYLERAEKFNTLLLDFIGARDDH